jgi:hypothetical protein
MRPTLSSATIQVQAFAVSVTTYVVSVLVGCFIVEAGGALATAAFATAAAGIGTALLVTSGLVFVRRVVLTVTVDRCASAQLLRELSHGAPACVLPAPLPNLMSTPLRCRPTPVAFVRQ